VLFLIGLEAPPILLFLQASLCLVDVELAPVLLRLEPFAGLFELKPPPVLVRLQTLPVLVGLVSPPILLGLEPLSFLLRLISRAVPLRLEPLLLLEASILCLPPFFLRSASGFLLGAACPEEGRRAGEYPEDEKSKGKKFRFHESLIKEWPRSGARYLDSTEQPLDDFRSFLN
jgi:hypothetical protein